MKRSLLIVVLAGGMIASLQAQNTPPIIVCPTNPVVVECAGPDGAPVALIALVSDVDSNALTVTWSVDGTAYQTNELAAGTTAVATPVSFSAVFGSGQHEVLISVTDGLSDPVICTNSVEVVDTTPPVIQSISATPNTLWPPNHKMRPVQLTVVATDTCGSVTCRVASVTSSEPLNGAGDGNTWIDWALVEGQLKVYLRAERSGRGRGRTYTVNVECADAAGNASTASVDVFVPHDQGQKKSHKPQKPKQNKQPKKGPKKGKAPKH